MIKDAIILAALAVSSPTVIDGDTIRIAGVSVRLTDYDAPELFSAKCPRERALAMKARQELGALLMLAEAGSIKMTYRLVPCAFANYGRLCAEGSVDGKPLAAHMIKLGFASSYTCRPGWCPPKQNWCRAP